MTDGDESEEEDIDDMCRNLEWSFLRQYMSNKITKYGFKIWCLNDPSSGYFYCISVYAGKRPGEDAVKRLGTKVVVDLVKQAQPYKGSVIVCDRYFGSVHLVLELKKLGYYCICTMQSNRIGFPEELVKIDNKDKRGTIRYATCKDKKISAVGWKDSKGVYLIGSTGQVDGDTCERRIKRSDRKDPNIVKEIIDRPGMVTTYNKYMGGVDAGDRHRSHLNLDDALHFKKWYKKLFFGLVGMMVVNASILWSECGIDQGEEKKKTGTIDRYTTLLQSELLGLGQQSKPKWDIKWSRVPVTVPVNTPPTTSPAFNLRASPSPSPSTVSDVSVEYKYIDPPHTVMKIPTPQGVSQLQRLCVLCKLDSSKLRSRTTYMCEECELPLCTNQNGCWQKYHANEAYFDIQLEGFRAQYKTKKK
jgi:hypothetical protein